MFGDEFVHFGGDEVNEKCWDNRPDIKKWMEQHDIKTYRDLQIYYRKTQKKIWTDEIKSKKRVMYWTNEAVNLPVENGDIIHWWGN